MSEDKYQNNINGSGTDLYTEEVIEVKKPDLYMIILLNDDYTPRDFVVWVLMTVFYKNEAESNRIMMEAHVKGRSVVGNYPHDVAKTKIMQVENLAEKYEHPLKCIIEIISGE